MVLDPPAAASCVTPQALKRPLHALLAERAALRPPLHRGLITTTGHHRSRAPSELRGLENLQLLLQTQEATQPIAGVCVGECAWS
jgi:hypothetical protein